MGPLKNIGPPSFRPQKLNTDAKSDKTRGKRETAAAADSGRSDAPVSVEISVTAQELLQVSYRARQQFSDFNTGEGRLSDTRLAELRRQLADGTLQTGEMLEKTAQLIAGLPGFATVGGNDSE